MSTKKRSESSLPSNGNGAYTATRKVELREEATEGEETQLTGQCPDLPFRQAQLRVHKEAVQFIQQLNNAHNYSRGYRRKEVI
jgi:hypothetical protein